MKRNKRGIVSIMLILCLLIPSLTIVDANTKISYSQKDNGGVVSIQGQANRPVSISIRGQSRYYYIDQGLTDDFGQVEFTVNLPKNQTYDCQVNIGGQIITREIIGDESNGGPEEQLPKEDRVGIYIEGYRGTILDKENIKIRQGESVLELTSRILRQENIAFEDRNGYIVSIDGQAEFDMGKDSGWMFTVNGTFLDVGAGSARLKDGDRIKWLYTHNLGEDVGNPWIPPVDASTEADRIIEANLDIVNNRGELFVDLDRLKLAINSLSGSSGSDDKIIINAQTSDHIGATKICLPKEALEEVVRETSASLIIQTPIASVTIGNPALASIVDQSRGNRISLLINRPDGEILDEIGENTIKNSQIFDICLMSDEENISTFDGETISISLPYILTDPDQADRVAVWHLNDDRQLNRVDSLYNLEKEVLIFETSHLSYYIVGIGMDKDDIGEVEGLMDNFTDVSENDWYYESVKFAVENRLFSGISDRQFNPNGPMTRAMLATVVYKMEGLPSGIYQNKFVDVEGDKWYTNAILWANAKGIARGYGHGRFGTNDPITREEVAVILYKYARFKGYDIENKVDLSTYDDFLDISPWAQEAMEWANANNIISGRSEKRLSPKDIATRAELTSILKKLMEGFIKED